MILNPCLRCLLDPWVEILQLVMHSARISAGPISWKASRSSLWGKASWMVDNYLYIHFGWLITTSIYIHMYITICAHVRVHIFRYLCMHTCIHVHNTYIYIYMCGCIHVGIYKCKYIYIYIHVCVQTYLYRYRCMHIDLFENRCPCVHVYVFTGMRMYPRR